MTIQKISGTITHIDDLSITAKEIVITLAKPLFFEPGSFVNVFLDSAGKKIRRAFSLSSSYTEPDTIAISIRHNPKGEMSPLFWNTDLTGTTVEVMGPLGLNTADKMNHDTVYLFGFGIGAGVIKSLAAYFTQKPSLKKLVICTGSRTDEEVLFESYFAELAIKDPRIIVSHVVSQPSETSRHQSGYIQDSIRGYSFENADVYICGQEVACAALRTRIESKIPQDCMFFIEAFH